MKPTEPRNLDSSYNQTSIKEVIIQCPNCSMMSVVKFDSDIPLPVQKCKHCLSEMG